MYTHSFEEEEEEKQDRNISLMHESCWKSQDLINSRDMVGFYEVVGVPDVRN